MDPVQIQFYDFLPKNILDLVMGLVQMMGIAKDLGQELDKLQDLVLRRAMGAGG